MGEDRELGVFAPTLLVQGRLGLTKSSTETPALLGVLISLPKMGFSFLSL